jgi:hypothetical protein
VCSVSRKAIIATLIGIHDSHRINMNKRNTNRNSSSLRLVNLTQQRIPANVRSALRSIRRQDNQQSILVGGPNDPRPIRRDILVTKVVEDSTASSTTKTYTYNDIYKLLDVGATPFFTEMRIICCSLYEGATIDGSIRVNVVSDGASYTDHGVAGSRRPGLHIRFPEVVRIAWVSTASTVSVLTISGGTTAGYTGQFTIEVRGDASGST